MSKRVRIVCRFAAASPVTTAVTMLRSVSMGVPERAQHTWKFVVAYHGARFQGWQKQADQRTVQGVLEAALEKLSGEPVHAQAAGRTDAGVHARGQLVSATITSRVRPEKMVLAMNAQLDDDLSVLSASMMPDGFDARRDSIAKRYVYRVHHAVAHDPFVGSVRWHVRGALDIAAMQRAAQDLVGDHDYESFRSVHCDARHARRYLWKVDVVDDAPEVRIEVRGNAFCRNMVRIIAGTLVDVGRGRLASDAMPAILQAKKREAAGITAPAHGLTMEEVYLPEDAVRAGIPPDARFPGWPPTEAAPAAEDVVDE
jgi:tRNA pseudouridine38-40 synthase